MARELPVFTDPACRGAEDVLFFGKSTLIAQSICARCPSADKTRCYDYALHVLVDGVWGGTTRTQRDQVRKELGIRAEQPQLLAEEQVMVPAGECPEYKLSIGHYTIQKHVSEGTYSECVPCRDWNLEYRRRIKARRKAREEQAA